jgi:hypothetical protein
MFYLVTIRNLPTYRLLITCLLLIVAYLLLTWCSLIIDSLSRTTQNSLPTTYYLLLTI